MRVVNAEQMRRMDASAPQFGVSGLVLMENAGKCVFEVIEERFAPLAEKICMIFCGKGNNGGDGYRIAELLLEAGANVTAVALGEKTAPQSDAFEMRQRYLKAGGVIISAEEFLAAPFASEETIIVDALFGTGLSGELTSIAVTLIEQINSTGAPVISVDLPSGIHADTGQILGTAVQSSITVTFAFYKPAHFLMPSSEQCGELLLKDIGIPAGAAQKERATIHLFDKANVDQIIPKYKKDEHKGSCGKLLILGGSLSMGGAPALAAMAAMRSGCGIGKLMVPQCIWPSVSAKCLEIMTLPMRDTIDGTFSKDTADAVIGSLDDFDAVLIGCGMGVSEDTEEIVLKLLDVCKIPMVVDADGLNILSKHMQRLKNKCCPVILTPHVVEMARLMNLTKAQIEADRIGAVKKIAKEYDLTAVLKGPNTLTASTDGMIFINSTGNPGMATAGSGDALAGVIGAFAARGIHPFEAAAAGVYIHGYAGDLAAQKLSHYGMVASDIIAHLPMALKHFDYHKNEH